MHEVGYDRVGLALVLSLFVYAYIEVLFSNVFFDLFQLAVIVQGKIAVTFLADIIFKGACDAHAVFYTLVPERLDQLVLPAQIHDDFELAIDLF